MYACSTIDAALVGLTSVYACVRMCVRAPVCVFSRNLEVCLAKLEMLLDCCCGTDVLCDIRIVSRILMKTAEQDYSDLL